MRILLAWVVAISSVSVGCGGDDDPVPADAGDEADAAPADAAEGDAAEEDAGVDAGPPGRDAGPPACGNFELEGDEICDDGNTTGGDGCSADCMSNEACGNGYVDDALGEVCDDGNTVNGDGCSADCASDETCGNGTVDVGEVCDDGNTDDGDGCSADCSMGPTCGDGVANGGEVCDDGNTDDADGCSADCSSDESCGNGLVDTAAGELCDDGNATGGDGCSATCAIEICGNGTADVGEACDDGNDVTGDGCESDCTFSCAADGDCDDGALCNGLESCNTTTHVCAAGTPAADATDCGGGMVCRGGACVSPVCGNGIPEASEVCDDGNTVEGDGCDTDCTYSCTMDTECTDGQVCTGNETCNTTTHRCENPPDLADGTACGTDLVCRSGACASVVCGDGRAEGSEICDDGNMTNGDGCDNDCTYSCTMGSECDDGQMCNGVESCNTTSHRCRNPADASDGTPCGSGLVCRGGVCTTTVCGNSLVETGEQCDDGNTTDGDGCDNDCTWSCTVAADCNDGLVCNGAETCNTTTHMCAAGTVASNGTTCDRDMMSSTRDVCLSGVCNASTCGDAYVDTGGGEQCEDGNGTNGDGCDNDCTWSCTVAADCTDGLACNGAETCNTTTHVCGSGTPPSDGTVCDRDMMSSTRDICRGGTCLASSCGDGFVDSGAGEQCEDGNTTNGDGCDNDCTWSCTAAADCTDGRVCNGSETCNTTTHLCAAGTPASDGTVCDRDMNPSTRDICRSGSCQVSVCGDGYLDSARGETCDDGNLVAGDGCEPTCTPTGLMPTAYRIDELDIKDPHIFADLPFFGCYDITDRASPIGGGGVNDSINDSVDSYELNYIDVFRPFDRTMTTNPMDFVAGECMAGAMRPSCQVGSMGTAYPTIATHMSSGTCLAPLPDTTRYSDVPTIGAPCFVTAPRNMTLLVGGISIPFKQARIASTYPATGNPVSSMNPGMIIGYLTVADAKSITFPDGTPLVAEDTLYSHLAAGGDRGSSCRTSTDDRDDDPTTGATDAGFWFYLRFTAIQADWVGP